MMNPHRIVKYSWLTGVLIVALVNTFCLSSSDGSWTDGMKMEDYKPQVDSAPPHLQNRPLIQIPCGFTFLDKNPEAKVYPLRTLLDTSLSTTTVNWNAIRADKDLSSLVVQNYDGIFIPSGSLSFRMGSVEATVQAPTIRVVKEENEASSFDLRLGLDFLNDHEGIINLRDGELHILVEGNDVIVPFLRPRPSFGDDL